VLRGARVGEKKLTPSSTVLAIVGDEVDGQAVGRFVPQPTANGVFAPVVIQIEEGVGAQAHFLPVEPGYPQRGIGRPSGRLRPPRMTISVFSEPAVPSSA
jgi:hypothetical protein